MYHISEAPDGQQGIEKALEMVPDLIICDVMMPKKDGFEVTRTIRDHMATSHIPLILLTAKASRESRMEGISRGADVYLTKPFSPRELNLRIKKLIELRQLLKQRFRDGTDHDMVALPFPVKKEKDFVTSLQQIVNEHLDSPGLNGSFIGKAIGISRMQLHRKLRALTGKSAGEFIREIRLQQAYKLLKAGDGNISQIAYQTGFTTSQYFSTAFKKRFHISPSQVLKDC